MNAVTEFRKILAIKRKQ